MGRRLTQLSKHRLGHLAAALTVATCLLALQPSTGGATTLQSEPLTQPLTPYVIDGQQASISQFPWQAYVLVDDSDDDTASCGGSILSATTILTAAHCVDHEGTTTPYPADDALVIAGASEVLLTTGKAYPSSSQIVKVKSLRTDPLYDAESGHVKDDVALLTLEQPLTLSAADNTAAIGLVASGATPAPGTTLSVSGYGKEEGAEGAEHYPTGKLNWTTMTAISSDACRDDVGVNSAVLLCAESATSATCQGDSGGAVTEGSPAVEVGVVDEGPSGCPPDQPDVFTNLAAPEVRAFIEGSESPPVAARPTSAPVLEPFGSNTAPVDFTAVTCEPGAWSGSPSFSYTFQVENTSAQVLQSGTSNVFTVPSSLVGDPLVCIVQATNSGGVSTYRSATSAPVMADSAPPTSSITAVRCAEQTCTLQIGATDPNALALTVTGSAEYEVTIPCATLKKQPDDDKVKRATAAKTTKRYAQKAAVCRQATTVTLPIETTTTPGAYQAIATGLPDGETISFSISATDSAGLKQSTPAVISEKLKAPVTAKKKDATKKAAKKKKKKKKTHKQDLERLDGPWPRV